MKMDEAQAGRLLALYASGQLRTAEKTQLFAAALENQELFEALAHEDAMRDVLELPGAKDRLVASLTPQRKNQWFAWAGGLAAVAAALVVVIAIRNRPSLPPAESIEVVGQSEPAQAPVSTARIPPKKAEVASGAAPQSAAAPRAKLAKAYSGPGKAAAKEEAPQRKLAVLADKVEPRAEVLVEKREVRASPMAAPASLPNSARSNVIASEDAMAIVASTPAYRISRRGSDVPAARCCGLNHQAKLCWGRKKWSVSWRTLTSP